jgi:ribonuclease III
MTNPKGDLIDYCRNNDLGVPSFDTRASGPEHSPTFITRVVVGGQLWAEGKARTKRDAERNAALLALDNLAAGTPDAASSDDLDARSAHDRNPDDPPPPQTPDQEAWPIYPEVLAETLRVANSRLDVSKRGASGVEEVRQLTVELYKSLLEDLGH